MEDAKQQLIEKLKSSNNILVTVSRDPSVDQLASCIGLTLLLNKQGKHAAAVFSGSVPSTIEFLQPEATIEKNTDSLRDFIISLDKGKADKLRYKVEEDVVRIFITPYKTSLSEDDLEFSEGDFNVDVVVALGVAKQEDLDQAITAHGRILHDATVTSINTSAEGGLGTINWHDPQASSLSELVTDLTQALDPTLLDSQIATALLTGIVAETGRFSNDKTSSLTMSASAALMAAGANPQLVANKLEEGKTAASKPKAVGENEDGLLEIDHISESDKDVSAPKEPLAETPTTAQPEPSAAPEPPAEQPPAGPGQSSSLTPGPKLVTEPPKLGGTLTANSETEHLDPVTDPMSLPATEPPQLLDHKDDQKEDKPAASAAGLSPTPPPPGVTLTDLEKSVHSPHVAAEASPAEAQDKVTDLESMRNEVDKALSSSQGNEPIEALNAQPLGNDLHPSTPPATPGPTVEPTPSAPPVGPTSPIPPSPGSITPPSAPAEPEDKDDPNSPPPVPPPIPFQFGNSPPPQ